MSYTFLIHRDGGLAAARSARVEERSAEAAHAVQPLPSSSTQRYAHVIKSPGLNLYQAAMFRF